MKKKFLQRFLFGIPVGIAIGYMITIAISLANGGQFSPCMPQLTDFFGNEAAATLIQAVLCAVIGGMFGGCSIIWELDWTLFKQTAVYFAITCPTMMLCAYLMFWMEHSWKGFGIYFAIFAGIFIGIWLAQYFAAMVIVKRANKKLGDK